MTGLGHRREAASDPHETAVRWLLRQEKGRLSAAEAAELHAWIAAHPGHQSAWDGVRRADRVAAVNAADPRLMAMRQAALATRPQARRFDRWAVAAAWAGVALLVGAVAWTTLSDRFPLWPAPAATAPSPTAGANQDPRTAVYRTAVGERAAISLPDGSVATLDTDSAVQIAYTDRERGVRLLSGQILLDVAKHKPIPFQVYAAGHRITAVGTRFDVRLAGAGAHPGLKVALLEGVIRVTRLEHGRATTASPSVVMGAGQVLDTQASAPLRVADADVEGLASWRNGTLTFDDSSLGAAVAEMNRYTTRPISISDPRIAALRISGVFKSGDADLFVDDVAEALPVKVGRRADGGPQLEPAG